MKKIKLKKFLLEVFAVGICLSPWMATYAAQQEVLWGAQISDYASLLKNFSLAQPSSVKKRLRLPQNFNAQKVMVNSFEFETGNVDYASNSHVRYNQYYQGIPVWATQVIYHITSNNNTTVTGAVVNGIEKDVTDLKGKMSLDQIKKIAQGKNSVSTSINAEKIIFFDPEISPRAFLAYYVSYATHTSEGPSLPSFIIDANSGKILQEWNALPTIENGQGIGGVQSKREYVYGQSTIPQSLGFLEVAPVAGSQCNISNNLFKVYNLKNLEEGIRPGQLGFRTPVSTVVENSLSPFRYFCTAPNNNDNGYAPVNGGRSPVNDVTYFVKQTFTMLGTLEVTNPIGDKLPLRVYTHIANYDNAYACDAKCMVNMQVVGPQQLVFGNGATLFAPLTEGDVVAHEFAHLVTANFSNLLYQNQSGGMNEAFSDMTGMAINHYLHGKGYRWYWNTTDWTTGLSISKKGKPLRYFDEPTKDGVSISNAANFKTGMNTHLSSGVYNKAFYLLSVKTPGWTIDQAYRVMLDANMTRWTPSATYITGACGVAQAAANRGYAVQDVKNAFAQVGVVIPDTCKT